MTKEEKLQNMRKILIIMSVCFLVGSVVLLVRTCVFYAHAQTAHGRVLTVETVTRPGSRRGSTESTTQATFVFIDQSGHTQTAHRDVMPYIYHAGDKVDLLYDPADRGNVRVASFWGTWNGPIVTLVGSLLLAFFARLCNAKDKKTLAEQSLADGPAETKPQADNPYADERFGHR